jgi:prepilin-type N-terminal cleavage/methylation domain-containing protein
VNLLRRLRTDRGTTLTELIVGMAVMAVFMAIATGVIVNMNQITRHTDNVVDTAQQLNTGFLKLDRTVRYASAISVPSTAATGTGNWYVELQTTNSGTTTCTQLQLSTTAKRLNWRTWTPGSGSSTPAFTAVTGNVNAPATGAPFTRLTSGNLEQLTITINASQGTTTAAQTVTSNSSMTFTAVNSSAALQAARSASPPAVCTQARP